jgi:hypothetical protein
MHSSIDHEKAFVSPVPQEQAAGIFDQPQPDHSGTWLFGARVRSPYIQNLLRSQELLCGKCEYFDRERLQHPGRCDFPGRRVFL